MKKNPMVFSAKVVSVYCVNRTKYHKCNGVIDCDCNVSVESCWDCLQCIYICNSSFLNLFSLLFEGAVGVTDICCSSITRASDNTVDFGIFRAMDIFQQYLTDIT